MANATADSYSAASGATVRGGRFGGIRTASAVGGIASAEAFGSALMVPTIPSTGTTLTTFTVQSAAGTGTYPFRIGLGFAKSETTQVACNLPNYQVEIKRTWNDGSVKHAIITGRASMTSAPSTISVTNDTPISGAALSFVLPSNTTVQLGSFGTASLATATLVRTWSSGPELVERHYRSDVGTSGMSVWFRVRHYADGRKWVKFRVENGYLDNGSGGVSTNVDRTYVPIVTLNGTIIYNNAGASLTHYTNTAWFSEGWIGGDPQVTALHNVVHLRKSRLVPNYGWGLSASASALNSLTQTYTPMTRGDLPQVMSGGGDSPHIALLPRWNALYCMTADARALKSTLANAAHLNSYAIVWRDKTTNLPIKPSQFATWSTQGPGANGDNQLTRGTLQWEINHHPGEAYLAYLLTGDYDHYETMLLHVSFMYAILGSGTTGIVTRGNGTSRMLVNETRGAAWCMRSMSQFCGIAPDAELAAGQVAAEYRTLLANNATYWKNVTTTPGINGLGLIFCGASFFGPYAVGYDAPWQTLWWSASMGLGSNLEPLSTMTDYNVVRDWLYRVPVGMLGDSTGYKWSYASAYNLKFSNSSSLDPTTWYSTWAQVFSNNFSGQPDSTGMLNIGDMAAGNTVPTTGGSGGPETGPSSRWAYLMGAISYAVEHNATGAATAFNRMLTATNWSAFDSGIGAPPNSWVWHDDPKWGIWPNDPDWYAGMVVGEARRISNSSFSLHPPTNNPNGLQLPSILSPWCGLAIDTRTGDIHSTANGGHGDQTNNGNFVTRLLENNPRWYELYAGSSSITLPVNAAYNPDGLPVSAHTYYSQQVIERHNRAVRFGVGSGASVGNAFSAVDGFNVNVSGTNGWDAAGTYPVMPGSFSTGGNVTCKNPITEEVYFFQHNGSVFKFTPNSSTPGGSWVNFSNVLPVSFDESACAYDTLRNRVFLIGGSESMVCHTFDISTKVFTSRTLTGAQAANIPVAIQAKGFGLVYIPALDAFLLKKRAAGSAVYKIDASTFAVTLFSVTGGSTIPESPPVSGTSDNIYTKWLYFPRLRGVVYVPGYSDDTWFIRTH